MAFDEGLAQRVREHLAQQENVEEKMMFGGICFMVADHMCCGILENKLMARIGPENHKNLLKKRYTKEMDFTGKPMKGMIYVESDGLTSDQDLKEWIDLCLDFIHTLPPKK